MPYPPADHAYRMAYQIVQTLRQSGYEAWFAGGCVRDLLLGRTPLDYDVATSATPDVVLDLFDRTYSVGAHFGVVLVATSVDSNVSDGSQNSARVITEVATFRSDGAYSDGRRPDAVRYTKSAEEDVQRRDFTINGLLLDPVDPDGPAFPSLPIDGVRDFVGGLADLEAGIVRAIGNPEQRFLEDRLRMLRAVRFAARFHFELEQNTRNAVSRLAAKVESVSRERVRDELTRMLTEGNARVAFELLETTGLLAEVLPEIAKMKGVEQPAQFHPEGDVWIHTLGLLGQLEVVRSPTLAWGALLHDVGKPATFRRAADRIRFDGHVEVGLAIAGGILRRFRFSNDDASQILALVANHMRFADAHRMKDSTLKRFFRLENFDEHLELHRMDCMAASGNLDHWNFVRQRRLAIPEESVRPQALLTGTDLIVAGYVPGPAFKEMLTTVEDAQLEGVIASFEQAMQLVQERFGPAKPAEPERQESKSNQL